VAKKEKEKADFVIEPSPVDLRNFFKGEKVVIVRTVDGDKKIELRLQKFDEDDIEELGNAHDYLADIIEGLEDENLEDLDNENDDPDHDDDDDDDDDEDLDEEEEP
jgi:hypothetical protein